MATPTGHQPHHNHAALRDSARGRTPSLTPSDVSSECSLSIASHRGGFDDEDDDEEDDDEDDFNYSTSLSSTSSPPELLEAGLCGGLAPRPRPRPRPRARQPPPSQGLAGGGLRGDDDVEFFMRRGGWKRRGIVFVNEECELAGEDETFEI